MDILEILTLESELAYEVIRIYDNEIVTLIRDILK